METTTYMYLFCDLFIPSFIVIFNCKNFYNKFAIDLQQLVLKLLILTTKIMNSIRIFTIWLVL